MKIISKRQAMALYRQHPQSRLFRFCTGKYQWSGSICHYAGREVQDISGVLAVFAERRQDRNGPYVVLRSVTLNKHIVKDYLNAKLNKCSKPRYCRLLVGT